MSTSIRSSISTLCYIVLIASCLLLQAKLISTRSKRGHVRTNFEMAYPKEAGNRSVNYPPNCGKVPMGSSAWRPKQLENSRAVNGQDSNEGMFPPYVNLKIMIYDPWNPFASKEYALCGGVLISDFHVLTAGHCLEAKKGGYVGMKDITILHTDEYEKIWSEKNVRALRYSVAFSLARKLVAGDKSYDIAIIEMNKPLEWDNYIQPACIPREEIPPGGTLYMPGMGAIGKNGNKPVNTNRLQFMPAGLIDCPKRDQKDYRICTKTQLDELNKSCISDPGSPLFWRNSDGKLILAGILTDSSDPECLTMKVGQEMSMNVNRVDLGELLSDCDKTANG